MVDIESDGYTLHVGVVIIIILHCLLQLNYLTLLTDISS